MSPETQRARTVSLTEKEAAGGGAVAVASSVRSKAALDGRETDSFDDHVSLGGVAVGLGLAAGAGGLSSAIAVSVRVMSSSSSVLRLCNSVLSGSTCKLDWTVSS